MSVFEQVLALLKDPSPPSRNRHFASFAGQRGGRVHRLYRLYRALAQETSRLAARPGATARLRHESGDLWLELSDPELAYRRRCLLPPELSAYFSERLAQRR
ncbi:MAG: hypothetical protein KKC30_05530 [Proteobacteria bacterium]|nr:hypothetical protein [Pseudomonadota bacterium]MBU4384295.1 hypothetical protein [Pseudomonadota bacterium]MBU4604015.1 hypothetical protein [Pseudomonadota bacterium]MCG2764113.1 hypothetical protein [Desulfarculaceae bacterium]